MLIYGEAHLRAVLRAYAGHCAVLGCGVDELLLPEPGKVPQPAPEGTAQPAAAAARAVTPRARDGRSLPPR
jgi:hypothetical protein